MPWSIRNTTLPAHDVQDLGFTTPCWVLRGREPQAYGYQLIRWNGKRPGAHRVFYEVLVGPIPVGLVIDHLCRVRHCVNPDHLEPVTNAENIARGERAQRTHCANGHPFDDANTAPRSDGKGRSCRECSRQRTAAWRERTAA